MTAISRPPLAPLFADNAADFYGSWSPGTSIESIVGFRSSDMTADIAIGDKVATPQTSFSVPAFAAIPKCSLLIARGGTLVYRMDGRKVRSANPASGLSFFNAYFNGRAITAGVPPNILSTVDPQTLVRDSTDIEFGPGGGVVSIATAASDRVGNVAGIFTPAGSQIPSIAYWNSTGTFVFAAPLTIPTAIPAGLAQSGSVVQIEFDAAGQIWLIVRWSNGYFGSSFRWFTAEKHRASDGSLIGSFLISPYSGAGAIGGQDPNGFTNVFGTMQSLWVSSDGTAFVTGVAQPIANPNPANPPLPWGNAAYHFDATCSLLWQTPLFQPNYPALTFGAFSGSSVCQVGGKLLFGLTGFQPRNEPPPFTSASGFANLMQVDPASGGMLDYFAIGAGMPMWLEPRSGRVGVFA
jgi:hypothetical protein